MPARCRRPRSRRRAPGLSRLPRERAGGPVGRSGRRPAPSRGRSMRRFQASVAARRHGRHPLERVDAGLREPPHLLPAEGHERGGLLHLRRPDAVPGTERPASGSGSAEQHRRRGVLSGARRHRLRAHRSWCRSCSIVCGYQLDVIIGGPLETVGPHGSYYSTANRQQAQRRRALARSTPNGPNMLIDAANGPCRASSRSGSSSTSSGSGTGAQPPAERAGRVPARRSPARSARPTPPSSARRRARDWAGPSRATTRDAAAPGVAAGRPAGERRQPAHRDGDGLPGRHLGHHVPGRLVERVRHLPGSPDGAVSCSTVTNTPPPPPPPTADTTPPTTPRRPPPSRRSTPRSCRPRSRRIPPTLPATGSSDATPLVLFGHRARAGRRRAGGPHPPPGRHLGLSLRLRPAVARR